jgi:hypothetical protein
MAYILNIPKKPKRSPRSISGKKSSKLLPVSGYGKKGSLLGSFLSSPTGLSSL